MVLMVVMVVMVAGMAAPAFFLPPTWVGWEAGSVGGRTLAQMNSTLKDQS